VREGWENLAFIQSAYESLERRTVLDVPAYDSGRRAS
jgi:hypothetical protein